MARTRSRTPAEAQDPGRPGGLSRGGCSGAAAEGTAAAPPSGDHESAASVPAAQGSKEATCALKKSVVASLNHLDLRFVSTQGKGWTCPLPPAYVEAPSVEFTYLGAAFVDPASGRIKAQRSILVVLKFVDEDGRVRHIMENQRPYTGGYYFFEDVKLCAGSWTLKLEAREAGAHGTNAPAILFCRHQIQVGPKGYVRPAEDDDEEEELTVYGVDCDIPWREPGEITRRKSRPPLRSCTGEEVEEAVQEAEHPTRENETVRRFEELGQRREWLFFEPLVAGETATVFGRKALHHQVVGFLNKVVPGARKGGV